jgi:spore coat protein CotF
LQQTRPGGSPENQSLNPNATPMMNHGAHEINDVHELLTSTINTIDHYTMVEQQVQCRELQDIIRRQKTFMTDEYNTLVECFTTGQDPSKPTGKYQMKQGNNVVYGLKQSPPKAPAASPAEIDDQRISSHLLEMVKSAAMHKAIAACESTNPVVRRVIADSIPNCIEMAYELFLYQNKRGFYQVPQFSQADMQQLVSAFSPAGSAGTTGMIPPTHMQ